MTGYEDWPTGERKVGRTGRDFLDLDYLEGEDDIALPRKTAPGKVSLASRIAPTPSAAAMPSTAPSASSRVPLVAMRAAIPGSSPRADSIAEVEAARGSSGQPLPGGLRSDLERASSAELSSVRVHTGTESARAASALGAKAYTDGQDIHFGAGKFEPSSRDGQELVAHEVAHTVQQRDLSSVPQGKAAVSSPGDAAETQADSFAGAFARGDNGSSSALSPAASPAALLRKTDEEKADKRKKDPKPDREPVDKKKGGGVPSGGKEGDDKGKADDKGKGGGGGGGGGGGAADDDEKGAKDKAGKPGKEGAGKEGAGKEGDAKDKEGKDKEGKDKEGKDKEGKDKEGKDKEGDDKEGKGKDKEGKKDGGPGGTGTEPPVPAQIDPIVPVVPVVLKKPDKLPDKVVQQWKKETGKTPEEHHQAIQTEIATFSAEVAKAQAELVSASDKLQAKIDATVQNRTRNLKQTVRRGKSTVAKAFGRVDAQLSSSKTTAMAAIQKHKAEGQALVKKTEATKKAELDAAFQGSDKAVAELITKQSPPIQAVLTKFAGELNKEGDELKKQAADAGKKESEKHDPSAHDGSPSGALAEGEASLREDVLKAKSKDTGKTIGAKIDKKIKPFGTGLDKRSKQLVTQTIKPYQDDLKLTLGVVKKGADKNFKQAAKSAHNRVETGEQQAKKAVEKTTASSKKRVKSEKKTAESAVDKAGTKMVDNVAASGKELSQRLRKRAATDSKFYNGVLDQLRSQVSRGGPFKLEDVQPRIEEVRKILLEKHPANKTGLEQMYAAGILKLDGVVRDQKKTFQKAVDEQTNQANTVRTQVKTTIAKGATDFGTALKALSSAFDATVAADTKKVQKATDVFRGKATEGLVKQKGRIKEKLDKVKEGIKKEAKKWIAKLAAKAKELADKEVKKKIKALRKDATAMRKAMDGCGTDENAIYAAMRKCSYGEIEALEAIYNDHYSHRAKDGKTPLIYDLDDEMSGDELGIAKAYLAHDRKKALKLELKDSTGFWNDDEDRIEAVLKSASDEEINYLNTDPSAKKVVKDVKEALGGCDLDVMNTLLDTSMKKEERHSKASAIRLYDAMDGLGTDEDKVKKILEGAKTEEERKRLRKYFNSYAKDKGWKAEGGDDRLDTALKDDFSGHEETLVLVLAKTKRDEKDVSVAKMLEAGEGAGTDEHGVFDALDDKKFEAKLKKCKTEEERKKLQQQRVQDLNQRFKTLSKGEYKTAKEFLDHEMGDESGPSYDEIRAGKTSSGASITKSMLSNVNLERMVAQRKLMTGQCEPDLLIKYACDGVSGTDEKLIKDALGSGGEPKSRAEVAKIKRDFRKHWKESLADRDELTVLDFKNFTGPNGKLSDELSGKDWIEVRILLCGKPETPVQLRYVTKMRVDYETSGVIGGGVMAVADAVGLTDTRSDLLAQEKRFDKYYDGLKKDLLTKKLSNLPDGGERLQALSSYLKDDAKAYGAMKSAIVDGIVTALEIIGGVLATILTAGTASPVLAAIIANIIIGTAGIAIKKLSLGDAYGSGDFAADFVKTLGTAGFAGLGEVKALGKFCEKIGKGVVGKVIKEGADEAGTFVAGGVLKISAKGKEIIEKVIAAGAKKVIIGSAEEVYSTLTDEKTYDKKFGQALWGEGSLGARLLKKAPMSFASGAVEAYIGEISGVGKHKSLPGNVLSQMVTTMGGDTAGFLAYVDNYKDASKFWNDFLKTNLKAGVSGAFTGVAGHRARAKKTARDLINGDITPEQLAEMDFLRDSERRKIAKFVHDYGDPSVLPAGYSGLYSPPKKKKPDSVVETDADTDADTSDDTGADSKKKPDTGPDKTKPGDTDSDSDAGDADKPKKTKPKKKPADKDKIQDEDDAAAKKKQKEQKKKSEDDGADTEDSKAKLKGKPGDPTDSDGDPATGPEPPAKKKTTLQVLNEGSLEELAALPGVGKEKAKKIIAHRKAKGPFKSVADVDSVHGVGKSAKKQLAAHDTENMLDVLNHGTYDELVQLPGIGEKKAKAILAHRKKMRASDPDAAVFGKVKDVEKVDGVGAKVAGDLQAKQKWALIDAEDSKPVQALKKQFKDDFDAMRADPKNARKSDYDLMCDIVGGKGPSKTKYTHMGEPVDLADLEKHGAFARTIGMESVYEHYMSKATQKQLFEDHKIRNKADFAAKVAADPSIFDMSMLDTSKTVSGKNAVAWWGPKGDSKATTAAGLIHELALDPKYYKGGAIRVTLDPKDAKAGGFCKPTVFDGMPFGEWKPEKGGAPLGVTAGGTPEAIAPPIPLSKATKIEVFK